MANTDALFEICTELCLLSSFSAKVIDQEVMHDQADLASLFYSLRAVSYQAKQLIANERPAHLRNLKRKEIHDTVANEGTTAEKDEVAKPLVNYPQGQHSWIAEVLCDIGQYARDNQMLELSAELVKLRASFASQLRVSEPATFGGVKLEGSAANHISFVDLSK